MYNYEKNKLALRIVATATNEIKSGIHNSIKNIKQNKYNERSVNLLCENYRTLLREIKEYLNVINKMLSYSLIQRLNIFKDMHSPQTNL